MVRGRRGSPRVGSWLTARRARGCSELLPLTVWWGWAGVLPVAGTCGVAEQGGPGIGISSRRAQHGVCFLLALLALGECGACSHPLCVPWCRRRRVATALLGRRGGAP